MNKPTDKIYPSYGVLNRIEKPIAQDRVDLEDASSIALYKRMLERNYTPDSLNNTGPYKAIVLRVDNKGSTQAEAGSWVQNYYGKLYGQEKVGSPVRIKARIPEIHAMLPVPESLGDNSTEHAIIDLYPTFTAQDLNTDIPEVGGIVWVDFGNKVNFTDPIYIKPFMQGKAMPSSFGGLSSSDAHIGACAGSFNSEPPKGDSLAGKNKPKAHTGPPMAPRNTKESVSKKHKTIMGHRSSEEVLGLWEKYIRADNGFPGISWIGNIPSNGLEDFKHVRGIRNTIIYKPNTTKLNLPTEMIYYFHGLNGFSEYEFRERIVPQLTKLASEERNFIFIFPELPYSKDSLESRSKVDNTWKTDRDNFSRFHLDVLKTIRTSFLKETIISQVSMIAFGSGGTALKNIIETNEIDLIKPNRIILAEADYAKASTEAWKYIQKGKERQLIILSRKEGTSYKNSKEFINENNLLINNEKFYFKSMKVSFAKVGNQSFTFVNPKIEEKKDKGIKSDLNNKNEDLLREGDGSLLLVPTKGLPKTENFIPPISSNADTSPSAKPKNSQTKKPLPDDVVVKKAEPFKEARVFLKDYGSISPGDSRLVKVPSSGGQRYLHVLAAKRLEEMNKAWQRENPGQPPIKIASGWRKRRWKNKQHYEKVLIDKYGSVSVGRKWIAYASPHESGLAFDIGNNGLEPRSSTNEKQKKTRLYNWLIRNAHKFGITPYKREAWHWEVRLPRASWASGEEFTDNYAVLVVKAGKGGTLPSKSVFRPNAVASACVSTLGDVT